MPRAPSRMLTRKRVALLALAACILPVTVAHAQSRAVEADRYAAVLRFVEQLKADYPDVPTISADSLSRALPSTDIVLVDVRSDAERAVSTLPGAITAEAFEDRLDEFRRSGRTLVAYCTIGARSSAYARRMRARGVDMTNLEGSVLAWTHAGGMLSSEGVPTRRLHVYGRRWNLAADGYVTVW
ncbi:MAG: rhodanese-like domain-containing protein [Gemmatimonadetes bacterium]|nr:rhodanese-like domain-containing protein [Gemmatimonadota bacterium]MYA40449.1 rhodanese-like domain-containing protein [Gemmatimonadota bacterium]MYE93696.1 rhodanese-like domain-containing protein [Gemmatimonadota bacterium]MYJ10547.1 rhodanese-like domain-containing protein [Gemmatimonadota bacterium]